MKRSKPLTRRVSLKSSGRGLRRTPIRKVSARKRKLETEAAKIHAIYKKRYPTCQRCGHRPGEQIHEILAGSFREHARMLLSCIFHLCAECHPVVQYWGRVKQLACKAINDPTWYDLIEVCEVLGCPTAITQAEVDAEIQKFDPFS